MSTIQVINAKHPSSATNNIVLDNIGNAAFAGTAAMASSFLRNRIINGDMRIDQRNAGASVTVNATNQFFCTDRWWGVGTSSAGVFTMQRSTVAPAGFTNSLLMTVATADSSLAAGDLYAVAQFIEGFNVADFNLGTASAVTFTLSFWIRSSVTGTFGGALGNNAANRGYPFTYTISAANTWEYKTVIIVGDATGTWATDNATGLRVYFGLGVGSSFSGASGSWAGSLFLSATGATNLMATNGATFYITGVQIEVGSAATPFERRQFGTEMMLCQRYYEKNTDIAINASSYVFFPWVVQKRTAPTATPSVSITNQISTIYGWYGLNGGATTGFSITANAEL